MKRMIVFLLMLNTTILLAQNNESNVPARQGVLVGAAIGGGVLLAKDSGVDMESYGKSSVLNLKLGWMITPRTAICLYIPSGGHHENGETRAFEAVLLTGQHWFYDKMWGMAGLGLAMDMPPFYDTKNDDPKFYYGTALSAGLGYEFLQKNNFVMDVQTRCLYGNYEIESVGRQSIAFDVLIGFNWY